MQSRNPLFEDLARILSGAAGTLAGAGREAEAALRERMRAAMGDAWVTRDEFEAVKAMAASARAEAEALSARVARLEAAGVHAPAGAVGIAEPDEPALGGPL